MRYAIGYQLPDEYDSILELVTDYCAHVAEVYFAWPGDASGRSPLGLDDAEGVHEAQEAMIHELSALCRMGVGLTLLLNANCYGDEAISLALERRVIDRIETVMSLGGLDCVTTTSPFIAKSIKRSFPALEVRASINMRVGSLRALHYLSEYFDSFYFQREHNRHMDLLAEAKTWCDANGKRLYLLANSGCLRDCPFQTFHDNLVAHEAGVSQCPRRHDPSPSPCWSYLHAHPEEMAKAFLSATWIRPEDAAQYAPFASHLKLATRMHTSPRRVLSAYVRGHYTGNLLDLMEPGFGRLWGKRILCNERLPADWFEKVTQCGQHCESCTYCQKAAELAICDLTAAEKLYTFSG